MSKFFGGGSDIDSDESGSDDMRLDVAPQPRPEQQAVFYDSSSSEEEKRVVRSQKDKRVEALKANIRMLRNSMKINDWVSILKGFESLTKLFEKSRSALGANIPRFYVQILVQLEDKLNETLQLDKDSRKKMSSTNHKSVNTMKQKLRKYTRSFEKFMQEYRKNPDVTVSEDENSEEASSESESEVEKSSENEEEHTADESFDDEFSQDSDDFSLAEDMESDFSSDSDIDLSHPAMERSFWVKKTKDEDQLTKVDRRKMKQPKDAASKKKPKEEVAAKEIEFTPEVVYRQLMAILSTRGKRGVNRFSAIKDLQLLATKASSDSAILKVKITLLSALFDLNFNSGVYMKVNLWRSALNLVHDILNRLEENESLRLCEDDDIEETVFADMDELDEEGAVDDKAAANAEGVDGPCMADDEGGQLFSPMLTKPRLFEKRKFEKREDGLEFVHGSIYAFVRRLHDEFIASLQNIDQHSQEYLDRLQDEIKLLPLAARAQRYYENLNKPKFQSLIALIRIESLYTKYDPMFDAHSEDCRIPPSQDSDPLAILKGDGLVLHRLCRFVYMVGDSRAKARAVICTVFHYAMHNHFHKARDFLLMSHVQDNISSADVSTQILFNRCTAMMGVCAFRCGFMQQAMNCLVDLYSTGKIKELLAQGVGSTRWNQERDLEKEKLERHRQVPYHLHISLDLLESVHLISAMLLEVPNLSAHSSSDKRHVISRNFRRIWDSFHKNAFNGPPDNTRDYVVASAIALSRGDWELGYSHLMNLKMWSLLPHADQVKASLLHAVKCVALKTFLIAFSAQYATMSCERLESFFHLPQNEVHGIVSKLIAHNGISGSWDQPTNSLIMKACMPNDLQSAALEFSDVIGVFVEQNERLMEHRHISGKSDKRNWGDRARDASGHTAHGEGSRQKDGGSKASSGALGGGSSSKRHVAGKSGSERRW